MADCHFVRKHVCLPLSPLFRDHRQSPTASSRNFGKASILRVQPACTSAGDGREELGDVDLWGNVL